MGILSTEHGLDISRTSTLEYFSIGVNHGLMSFFRLVEVSKDFIKLEFSIQMPVNVLAFSPF